MLAISTAACSSLLLPCSRAHVASARRRGLDAPLLGVPGFVSWLETHSPEALVEMPALPRENSEITPRDVDVVAFDLNSLVHNALRNARDVLGHDGKAPTSDEAKLWEEFISAGVS